jgi:hypothetical protein
MKYMDALRKYNEGSDKWCIPRKGTSDYFKIRDMMKKISSIQKSKSKDNSKEDLVEKNKRIKVLQAAIKRRLVKQKIKSLSPPKVVQTTTRVSTPKSSQNVLPFTSPTQNSYRSESRAFSSDYYKNQKATKIQKFLRDKLIVNKNNLNNRVNTYSLVSKRIADLKDDDCLENKKFKNGVYGRTIRGIINLEKQIGTPSKNGAIYLTSIPDFLGIHPIASKVMVSNADNAKEVRLMTKITKEIILQKTSRHFLMIYGSCVCSKKIAENLKLVSINELADGDLKMLIHNKDVVSDADLMFNIFIQTFISIATFQNVVGHIHRDPHYGNFLYQNNNDQGYYHYIFNGNSYYLKACKYNIVIYDYGFASPIVEYKSTVLPGIRNSQVGMIAFDYTNILHSFFNSKNRGFVNFKNMPPEPTNKNTLIILNKIQDLVREEFRKNYDKKGEKDFANYLFDFIMEEILTYAPSGMFLTYRPTNVINSTPFYISRPDNTTKVGKKVAPKVAKKVAPKVAKVASPAKVVDSRFTESFIAAAMLKRKEEYQKFVKDMRPKVKKNFPDLPPARVMEKVKELWKTNIRRKDALSTNESVRTPSPIAKKAKHTKYVNSTESNIAAAILKRKKEYKKFVKDMRVKVKENFPDLPPARVMAKVKDLWKTNIRRQEGLSTNASVYTPSA